MTGFGVDPDALEGAINKLVEIQEKAKELSAASGRMLPGELSAGDQITVGAYGKFVEVAKGPSGSMRESADEIYKKLGEKISAYRDTLAEYHSAEDAATIDADRVNRQQ